MAAKASWKKALTLVLGDPVKAWKVLKNHCFCRNILLEVKMNMKHVDITIRRIANHCFLIYLFIWNSHSRCTNIWKLSPLRCLKKGKKAAGWAKSLVCMCTCMHWCHSGVSGQVRRSDLNLPPPPLPHFTILDQLRCVEESEAQGYYSPINFSIWNQTSAGMQEGIRGGGRGLQWG